ncbi:disulfide bond formation protein B [Pseudomonas palleroniana]|uniref:disulfide bond formation protein B n=1 Tax=Pseudomonas palleroniana TaxID=191390 RepID=UPI001FCC879B|nr:disulfide bond formation protein B [Pseudomonas palleroniana]UOK40580.1 disulfide bond formation protein B [Pseudomonas palleroniana]
MNRHLNALGLLGMCVVLMVAFFYQFALHSLPCTLCNLIRAGLIALGLGFLFNLRLGIKNKHYSFAIVGALLAGGVSLRHMLLHIVPGDPGYAETVFGIHMYTWSAIASVAAIVYIAGLMLLPESRSVARMPLISKGIAGLFVAVIAVNLVSIVIEGGFNQDLTDPQDYYLLR